MIVRSKQRLHIDGKKKITQEGELIDLTYDKKIVSEVYFPMFANNGKELEVKVKVGNNVKVGDMLTCRSDFYVPYFSSVSGRVKEIKELYFPALNKKVNHLVIENDFKYSKRDLPKIDIDKASREEIIEAIKQAGIVGLGGAGFPTYFKYSCNEKIDTVLINAVECEPYLTTDHVTMKNNLELLLKGCLILKKAADANKVVIAFKRNKKDLKAMINKRLVDYPFIEIKEVRDAYPMGWEKLLIQKALKLDYEKLPSEVGVIVNNSNTCISVADALLNQNMITKRITTFSGNALKKPSNVLVPMGALVNKIIKKIGSYSEEEVCLLPGGPMTSTAVRSDEFALTPTMGGIIAMKKLDIESEPCLKCGACIENCPANIQPIEIKEALDRREVDTLMKLEPNRCCECGVCSFVCPSKIELTEAVKKAKLYLSVTKNKQGGNK